MASEFNDQEKNVLVCHGKRKRPLSFKPTDSKECILKKVRSKFSDCVEAAGDLVLQIKSEEWNGEWVDVLDPKEVPNQAILQCVEVENPSTKMIRK